MPGRWIDVITLPRVTLDSGQGRCFMDVGGGDGRSQHRQRQVSSGQASGMAHMAAPAGGWCGC
jgi:hypothetical protein